MSAPSLRNGVHSPVTIWVAMILAGASMALAAAGLRDRGLLTVERRVESIRSEPDGEKLGTLLKGAEVEELERDGKWVRIRVEAWMWGPSLAGFEEEEEGKTEESEVTPVTRLERREPRAVLPVELNRVRTLINDKYGFFYGISLNDDLQQIVVRFRVEAITREALEQCQMGVQTDLLEILREKVDFGSIRVETNRPDGTGSVGLEIAITSVPDIRPPGEATTAQWKSCTRLSSDGGDSWSGPASQVED